jgi:hypothetical protein
MNLRQAAEMALEALEITWATEGGFFDNRDKIMSATQALRQALAQPEQDPVGYVTNSGTSAWILKDIDLDDDTPIYTEPPKREWVDDDFGTVWQKCGNKDCGKFVVRAGKVDCWNGDCPEKQLKREWVGLVKGVRVEEDKVIIKTKDNNTARELCGKLIEEKNT